MVWETSCEYIRGLTEEEAIPICLNCPRYTIYKLPCIEDYGKGELTKGQITRGMRNERIRELRKEGKLIKELAEMFNLSEAGIRWILGTLKSNHGRK